MSVSSCQLSDQRVHVEAILGLEKAHLPGFKNRLPLSTPTTCIVPTGALWTVIYYFADGSLHD